MGTALAGLFGNFVIEKQGSEVFIGATGVKIFVGDNRGTPATRMMSGGDAGYVVGRGDPAQ